MEPASIVLYSALHSPSTALQRLSGLKEWCPPLCPVLTGAGNTPHYVYFYFCRHVRPRGIHSSMMEWMLSSSFTCTPISLQPLSYSLNPGSWIKFERHTHGSDSDRAVGRFMIGWLPKLSVQGSQAWGWEATSSKGGLCCLFFVSVLRADPIKVRGDEMDLIVSYATELG